MPIRRGQPSKPFGTITAHDARRVIDRLGDAVLQPSAHGFARFGPVPIREAAGIQAAELLRGGGRDSAAIRLLLVVLSANRNYNRQVRPHLDRIRSTTPRLTIQELHELWCRSTFAGFKAFWGHADARKFALLGALLDRIATLRLPAEDDDAVLERWAHTDFDGEGLRCPFAGIAGFGLATRQHLRMVFGADTVKPDRRVKEVIAREFGLSLSDESAITFVVHLSQLTGIKVVELDQIFVKYGSGAYDADPTVVVVDGPGCRLD